MSKKRTPLQWARDPRTLPAKLASLAREGDDSVRWEVLRNPNTPKETLFWLGERDPRGFVENPALPLLLLEEPGVGAQLSERFAMGLLAVGGEFPEVFWLEMAHHPGNEVRLQLARSTSSPRLLLLLSEDVNEKVRIVVTENPSLPSELPPEVLQRFAQDSSERIRRKVAAARYAPTETLRSLAKDEAQSVRRCAAENPATPPESLAHLAQDEDAEVRCGVARNPGAPASLLRSLAQDRIWILEELVENPATPVDVLQRLSRDADLLLREAASQRLAERTG